LESLFLAHPLDSLDHHSVCDVRAVPSHEEVNPVNRANRDMRGITSGLCGNDLRLEKGVGERQHFLLDVQEWKGLEQFEAFTSGIWVAGSCLIDNELREADFERLAPAPPPLFGDLLVSRDDEVTTWPGR
jgi:hypothetical protein